MPKLHELLAVETALENQATKCRSDLSDTFAKKRHLFEEKRVTFIPSAEGAQPETETQSDIQSTVAAELKWIEGILVKSLDASFQVAVANTAAKADIVLETGETVMTGVPATALLELEKRVAEVKLLVEAIPTLDPAKGFALDSARSDGVYKAREVLKTRTRKQKKVIVKYDATKEFPAQTDLVDEDVPVGRLQEQEWSGLITPAQKAELLNRVEILARGVRAARSRANDIEVDVNAKIGGALLKYVFGENNARAAKHEGVAKK
jgi:hypothetical protein